MPGRTDIRREPPVVDVQRQIYQGHQLGEVEQVFSAPASGRTGGRAG
ncbi:hypothetical protein ACIBF5_30080 [Micromonospora sp. NPDC050417]